MVGVTVRASEVFLRYFHCLKSALQYQSFILILILINNDPCEAETEFWLRSDDKWWMLGLEERSRCCCTGHSKAGAWKVGNKRIVEVCTIETTHADTGPTSAGDLWEEDIERVWPCRHCTSYHLPDINHRPWRWWHPVLLMLCRDV